jgi:hypothetical protein
MQRHYIHVYTCMQVLMPQPQIREPSSSLGPTPARSPAPSLASHVRSKQKICHRLPTRALLGTTAALAWPGWPTGQLQETAPLGCLLVPCSHHTHAGLVSRTHSPAAGEKVKQRTLSTSRHTTEDASLLCFSVPAPLLFIGSSKRPSEANCSPSDAAACALTAAAMQRNPRAPATA